MIGSDNASVESVAAEAEREHSGNFDSVIPFQIAADAAERLGLGDVSVLAVRPDRYIGFRSDGPDLEPIGGYLELVRSGGAPSGPGEAK